MNAAIALQTGLISPIKNGLNECYQHPPALTKPTVKESNMAEQRLCSIEGCGKKLVARGWCANHYELWRRTGAPVKTRAKKICNITGCESYRVARGYCQKHYWRLRTHGDPLQLPPKQVLPSSCKLPECSAPRAVGRKGLCSSCYLIERRNGDPRSRLKTRAGVPRRWLEDHVEHGGQDCLIWPFAKHPKKGEAVIQDRQTRQAARLMCILAHGEPPASDSQAAHECGNGHLACVNPKHLSWKSPKENCWDKVRHGTMRRGEKSPQAKLTEAQVKVIRAAQSTVPEHVLAAAFGVHVWTVSDIVKGRTWAWL